MHRRVCLTILEFGSSPTAWVETGRIAMDDWVVVAQQPDESAADLSLRVSRRASRLQKDGAELCGLDVFVASTSKQTASRLLLLRTLIMGAQLAQGATITLWFPQSKTRAAAEITEAVANRLRTDLRSAGITLAMRFYSDQAAAMAEEPSGIHAVPDFEEFGATSSRMR